MKKLLLAGVLALLSASSFAASDQVPTDRTITQISVYDTDAVVYFTPSFANTQGCTESAQHFAVINLENDKGQAMLSTALAAAASKSKIGLGLNGCKGSPLIYRVDIKY